MTVAKKSKPKTTPARKPAVKKQTASKASGSQTKKASAAKKSAPAKEKTRDHCQDGGESHGEGCD